MEEESTLMEKSADQITRNIIRDILIHHNGYKPEDVDKDMISSYIGMPIRNAIYSSVYGGLLRYEKAKRESND